MSALGDVLELLYGAHGRYESARLEAHERRNYRRQNEAYARVQREQMGRASVQLYGDGADVPEEGEMTLRIWFRQPNRFREERVEDGREGLLLGDGSRFWMSSPEWATVVQEGDGWVVSAQTPRMLLDPISLIPALEVSLRGAVEVAGRAAVELTATARRSPSYAAPLLWGATEYALAVDSERGVLLRLSAFLDGAPFSELEVTTIAFDEPLDDSLFRYDAPPGEEVLRPEDATPGEPVSVDEAARRASFTVLVPGSLGHGWHVSALYVAARPRITETVHISLFRGAGGHSVSIRETAGPCETWQLRGLDKRVEDGTTLHVGDGGWRRVLVERAGTCAELNSSEYTEDELVELALTLVPAPRERPPLLE